MFEEFLGDSEFVKGMLALALMGALIGAVLGAVRYAPVLVWRLIQRKWAVSVTTRDQQLIRWIGLWLAESDYGQRCQWLDARTVHVESGLVAVLMPGHGLHAFKEDGTRYWLEHVLEDQGVAGKISVLTIKTIGKGVEPLRQLIDSAVDMANEEGRNKNITYVNDQNGYWMRVRLSPRRSSKSLFLRQGLFAEILKDANKFLSGPDLYYDRGLPYRRGYMLHGPAGNGKSTVIQVLATELNLPIYMLSLTEPEMTDNGLARALGRTPDKCLLVIEDFEKIDLEKTDVTFSGLLNAVDGPLASEGRLLIVTANEPEAISKYFLRPGRIDRRWLIDEPDQVTIERCMTRFGVNGRVSREDFLATAKVGNWSMARVQQELLTTLAETEEWEPYDPSEQKIRAKAKISMASSVPSTSSGDEDDQSSPEVVKSE